MLYQMISEKTMSQFSCFQLWPCCFTSTEARLLIRDSGGGGGGGEDERVKAWPHIPPRKDWRDHGPHQNNGSVKAVSPCHCNRHSTAVLGRVTKTMSVALLLRNKLKWKKSYFHSLAPPPCSWSLLGQLEGPAPPPSSGSRYFQL